MAKKKVDRIALPWMRGAEFKAIKSPEPPWKGKRELKVKRWRKREKSTENAVVRYVKAEWGILSRKMNGMGFNSWPDRMFMLPLAPFFIEFKREGEVPTPLQTDTHTWLRSLGYEVEVHDNTKQAIESIRRRAMEAFRYSKAGSKVPVAARRRRSLP